jgi:hypothetical protein
MSKESETSSTGSVYQEQIEAIERKLEQGMVEIKQGHRVIDLNPSGEYKRVPLSNVKRNRLEYNLAILRYYSTGERISLAEYKRFNADLKLKYIIPPTIAPLEITRKVIHAQDPDRIHARRLGVYIPLSKINI